MERPKDLYLILGVSRDASPSAIKRAYSQLVKRYNPEAGSAANPDEFEELRAAYETLSDDDRRQSYDQSLQELEAPFAWTVLQDRPPEPLRRPISPASLTGAPWGWRNRTISSNSFRSMAFAKSSLLALT